MGTQVPTVSLNVDKMGDPVSSQQSKPSQFRMPVDSEHKAKTIWLFSFAQPHMAAFHLSWIAFFMTFVGTFAPAALLPIERQNMNFTKTILGNAGVAAVCGAIFARVFMGAFVDTYGPRYGVGATMLLFAPAVFCMSLANDAAGFQAIRFFIGVSLCMFVCCQFWCGSMFNVKIVGTANAIAAGWGNMGGGATHLIMPLIYEGIKHHGVPGFEAWRWAFFVPGAIYIITGITALVWGQDHPDGDYRDLKKSGQMKKGQMIPVLKAALLNYRTWIFFLMYGYCFGVELTVDNVITEYLYDQFGLNIHTAGALGSVFGLMNIFTRASGGMLSDICAKYWGIRGRLWCLWIIQTLGGVFCLLFYYVDHNLGATIAIMVVFSIFCQQACGATFGVVPFISKRGYGVVAGVVGAGGNVGAAITQAVWFGGNWTWQANLTKQEGFLWMGVQIILLTLAFFFVWFPSWGSMLTPGNPEALEEDYYIKEWSAEEVAQGLHTGAMNFAMESRSQRGRSQRGKYMTDASNAGVKQVAETSSSSSGSDSPQLASQSPAKV